MQQFFVDKSQIGKEYITITGDDVNHIKNALRMKIGDKIRISSGQGDDYMCTISEMSSEFVQADIDYDASNTELNQKIYLFQAIPKGQRMQTVIEKCVELGVSHIIPVNMKYCVVKLTKEKATARVAKYQAIAKSAAKQSKRSIIPAVGEVMDYEDAISFAKDNCDLIIVPYENYEGMKSFTNTMKLAGKASSVAVFIGPEGGFAPEEIDKIKEHSRVISLGRRILRTDTAAICMLSLLMINSEINEEI